MRTLALGTALVALLFGGFVLIFTALQAQPPAPAGQEAPHPMTAAPAGKEAPKSTMPAPAGGMGTMATPSPAAKGDMGGMGVTPQPSPMAGMAGMAPSGPMVPPVKGFVEGQEIRFIHTEASDPRVAKMLTDMMGSPVLVVPSLAQAPEAMLANVYVFINGIKGDGPFGFQPDVFDSPPGTPAYSPLRAVHLVTWKDAAAARELRSVDQVKEAEAGGELTLDRPGAVVNMPFLTWPGGQR